MGASSWWLDRFKYLPISLTCKDGAAKANYIHLVMWRSLGEPLMFHGNRLPLQRQQQQPSPAQHSPAPLEHNNKTFLTPTKHFWVRSALWLRTLRKKHWYISLIKLKANTNKTIIAGAKLYYYYESFVLCSVLLEHFHWVRISSPCGCQGVVPSIREKVCVCVCDEDGGALFADIC